MPPIRSDEITLRNTLPEDLNAVVILLRQLWPSKEISAASFRDSFMKSFSLEGHIIRCACYQGQVVGLLSLSIRNNLKAEGNLANIDELVVDEKMRSKQIGKKLLEDAEAIARQMGCRMLGLESSFHREGAHRFYDQNGYAKQGYYIVKDLE
jgi:(aminoalkyl)phosphonate N-acetyltransferase